MRGLDGSALLILEDCVDAQFTIQNYCILYNT